MADCRIKFFVADYRAPEISGYQHELIALAEGFQQLGVPFAGSNNYWMDEETGEYLIKALDGNRAYEINIFHERFLAHFSDWADYVDLTKTNILIDSTDGLYSTPCHNKQVHQIFDIILKTHYHARMWYPANVFPWAFGLTNRIMVSLDKFRTNNKDIDLLNNFSPGMSNHSVRIHLNKSLEGIKKLKIETINSFPDQVVRTKNGNLTYWAQTGKRHEKAYYATLNRARFTLAYGGFFSFDITNIWYKIFGKKVHAFNSRLFNFWDTLKLNYWNNLFFINQFDSYRLWEVFYSQSIPVMLNFQDQGFVLPELPVEGKHYISIDIANVHTFAERYASFLPHEIDLMEKAGKEWVIKFYSPVAVAQRFLALINFSPSGLVS